MALEQRIRAALRDCYDPQIPLNLVDLGLVQAVALMADGEAPGACVAGLPPRFRVTISLLATTEDEGGQQQLRAQVENRLAGFPEISRAIVTVESVPVWTPARISAEGRRLLKLDQAAFPILNNRLR